MGRKDAFRVDQLLMATSRKSQLHPVTNFIDWVYSGFRRNPRKLMANLSDNWNLDAGAVSDDN